MKLKTYLKKNNIDYIKFAKSLNIKLVHINGYFHQNIVLSLSHMERIYIATNAVVTPIDFILDEYKTQIVSKEQEFELIQHFIVCRKQLNFIKYVKFNIKLGILTNQDIAKILRLTKSSISKKMKGITHFKEDDQQKVLALIIKKIKNPKYKIIKDNRKKLL